VAGYGGIIYGGLESAGAAGCRTVNRLIGRVCKNKLLCARVRRFKKKKMPREDGNACTNVASNNSELVPATVRLSREVGLFHDKLPHAVNTNTNKCLAVEKIISRPLNLGR
jgi:hypothetical protein